MFCHTGPNSSVVFAGCQILRDTDLQIPILKNEQQLKLKVHKLWTTALWVIPGGGGGGVGEGSGMAKHCPPWACVNK